MSSRKLCEDCIRIECVKGCMCDCHSVRIAKKWAPFKKAAKRIEEIMYVIINVFCKNCHKEGRIHVKQDETKQMIEARHFCPHCNVKGKLSTVRQ